MKGETSRFQEFGDALIGSLECKFGRSSMGNVTLSMALSCCIRSILVNGLKVDSASCCWVDESIMSRRNCKLVVGENLGAERGFEFTTCRIIAELLKQSEMRRIPLQNTKT